MVLDNRSENRTARNTLARSQRARVAHQAARDPQERTRPNTRIAHEEHPHIDGVPETRRLVERLGALLEKHGTDGLGDRRVAARARQEDDAHRPQVDVAPPKVGQNDEGRAQAGQEPVDDAPSPTVRGQQQHAKAPGRADHDDGGFDEEGEAEGDTAPEHVPANGQDRRQHQQGHHGHFDVEEHAEEEGARERGRQERPPGRAVAAQRPPGFPRHPDQQDHPGGLVGLGDDDAPGTQDPPEEGEAAVPEGAVVVGNARRDHRAIDGVVGQAGSGVKEEGGLAEVVALVTEGEVGGDAHGEDAEPDDRGRQPGPQARSAPEGPAERALRGALGRSAQPALVTAEF